MKRLIENLGTHLPDIHHTDSLLQQSGRQPLSKGVFSMATAPADRADRARAAKSTTTYTSQLRNTKTVTEIAERWQSAGGRVAHTLSIGPDPREETMGQAALRIETPALSAQRKPRPKSKKKEPHPADDLSFMQPKSPKGSGIDYWLVNPSGSWGPDCEAGANLGDEYLAYIGKHPTNFNVTLLTSIVHDMFDQAKAGQRWSGVHLGFLQKVNGYAMAAATMMRKIRRTKAALAANQKERNLLSFAPNAADRKLLEIYPRWLAANKEWDAAHDAVEIYAGDLAPRTAKARVKAADRALGVVNKEIDRVKGYSQIGAIVMLTIRRSEARILDDQLEDAFKDIAILACSVGIEPYDYVCTNPDAAAA